jgi:hypothetical protein
MRSLTLGQTAQSSDLSAEDGFNFNFFRVSFDHIGLKLWNKWRGPALFLKAAGVAAVSATKAPFCSCAARGRSL